MINKAKSLIAAHRRRKRALKREQAKEKSGFPKSLIFTPAPQKYRPHHSYSVVTAAYGAEHYLDEFFSSLFQQTVGFIEAIEVILVDDGSTDGTLAKAREWEARYLDSIKVITQENGGPAAARNTGLKYASKEWVTFTDPDDFLAVDYFESVDRVLHENLTAGLEVDMVACQITTFLESDKSINKRHPLNYCYSSGPRLVSFHEDVLSDIKLSAASSFFRRINISAGNLAFPDLKPSFEDAAFIAKYLLSTKWANVLFSPDSIYFYRKRSAKNSLIDTARTKKEKYIDQIRDGYIPLLRNEKGRSAGIPVWLQLMVLYDLAWHFKLLTNNHRNWLLVPKELRKEYFSLLQEVFSLIDDELILGSERAGIPLYIKLGIISLFKGRSTQETHARIIDVDLVKREALVGFYHSAPKRDLQFTVGGVAIQPSASTVRMFEFVETPLVYETLAWVGFVGDGELSVKVEGFALPVSVGGSTRLSVSWHDLVSSAQKRALSGSGMPWEKRVIRRLARQPIMRRRYENAWILMDRDVQADDNAEHLYRYLQRSHPEINTWFVLRKSSHDWARLQRDGFRLLEYGSIGHKVALLNAAHLISSHADHYLFSVLPAKYYADMVKYRFTFLQHGVTKDDLSGWLNTKKIHCLVTAAREEFQSIVDPGTYKFTSKEVCLTGFPRHDRLLALAKAHAPRKRRSVIIMPTWRQSLAGDFLGLGNARAYNPEFVRTDFYQSWKGFLAHPELRKLAETYEVEFTFFPHANLEPYLHDFNVGWMKLASHGQKMSIQDLLVSADLMITDFSSIAFEFALLERPVLYYQFDREYVFSGGHLTRKGYFDYDQPGFGPVGFAPDDMIKLVSDVIKNRFQAEPEYAERMKKFFPFRDGQNCRRVVERIKSLDEKEKRILDQANVSEANEVERYAEETPA